MNVNATVVGMRINGMFSCLPFSGEIIGTIAECWQVKVDEPHAKHLPTVFGVLTFHPASDNIPCFTLSKKWWQGSGWYAITSAGPLRFLSAGSFAEADAKKQAGEINMMWMETEKDTWG